MIKNSGSFFLCLIVLFQSGLAGPAPDTNYFNEFILTRPLPQLFQVGEIYVLKGKLKNHEPRITVSADLNLIDGDYRYSADAVIEDSLFQLPLVFKFPGHYYLSLSLNHRRSESIIVTAGHPYAPEPAALTPVTDLAIRVMSDQVRLTWDTENELVELKLVQDSVQIKAVYSNQPDKIEFTFGTLSHFKAGPATFWLRWARSADGSRYRQNSDWGPWQTLEATLTEDIPPVQHKLVEMLVPFPGSGPPDSSYQMRLNIKSVYEPNAYILRPDGRVDKLAIQARQTLKTYSVGNLTMDLYPPGPCQLEFKPDLLGTYLIEINNDQGVALVNLPFYCGTGLPLVPPLFAPAGDSTDLALESAKMLRTINDMRLKVGVKPIRPDSELTVLAQYYADFMAIEKFCAHIAPNGEDVVIRKQRFGILTPLSENVAQERSIAKASRNLCHSPSHYDAMIDSSATRTGFGFSSDDAKNFYVAQYFSWEPLSAEEMAAFLTELFSAMKSQRKELKRIDAPDEWPAIQTSKFTAASLVTLRKMVLIDNRATSWGLSSVGSVYFEEFEQSVEGLRMVIKFYPRVKKAEEKGKE